MNTTYTLRGGRSRRAKKHPFLFLVAVLLALFLIFNFQFYPVLAATASAAVRNSTEALLARAVLTEMENTDISYDKLITLRYRSDGVLSTLSCDMPRLNSLRNSLMIAVLSELSNETLSISLPLGSIIGGDLFSGVGPNISAHVFLASGGRARMDSEFLETGINQTLHRVLFTVEVDVTVMLPTRPLTLHVLATYPIAETVIVGEVPDAYTKIHRLTDDITEQEIDDIYDFGAQAP